MSHLRESVACVLCGRKTSLGFSSVISPIFSVVSAVRVFSSLLANNNLRTDFSERLVFPMRTQLVETAKNICFGTDLHCSNVHSLISMAMIVTTSTSSPLWRSLAQYTVTDKSMCVYSRVSQSSLLV